MSDLSRGRVMTHPNNEMSRIIRSNPDFSSLILHIAPSAQQNGGVHTEQSRPDDFRLQSFYTNLAISYLRFSFMFEASTEENHPEVYSHIVEYRRFLPSCCFARQTHFRPYSSRVEIPRYNIPPRSHIQRLRLPPQ